MKAMLGAFVAIAVIGVIAGLGLHEIGFSSAEQGSSDAVRLGDEG
ncbi:hypothetical protein [Poseidonocella sedimentorum]|uniref:Uncharacterized protein n=1 Tax=Poseidonocella sedimentorum TaxID=871652 RepID=A0A1I6D3L0_9RHOB|nr:hypothetical protein [Poseidonocella sedimentorum]SFQ99907.1 hypothetical protein SAMN04515673_10250 [Poseidonocella sedimentorum]